MDHHEHELNTKVWVWIAANNSICCDRRPRWIPGFWDFPIFRKMSICEIFRWDLGFGKVCNRWEMAVGFKWADSQPISTHLNTFSTIFMILVILESIPMVWSCNSLQHQHCELWLCLHCIWQVAMGIVEPPSETPADSRIFGFFDFSENVDF